MFQAVAAQFAEIRLVDVVIRNTGQRLFDRVGRDIRQVGLPGGLLAVDIAEVRPLATELDPVLVLLLVRVDSLQVASEDQGVAPFFGWLVPCYFELGVLDDVR